MRSLLIIALLMAYTVNAKIHWWEKALNTAASSHVIANGITDPKKQRDAGDLGTPRVEFKSTFDGYGPNTVPHFWIHPDKTRWPDTRDGKLYARVVTRRDAKGQDHDAIVGTVRSLLQSCSALSQRMELHKMESIFESGTAIELSAGEHHDATILSFNVRMRILFDTKTNDIFIT